VEWTAGSDVAVLNCRGHDEGIAMKMRYPVFLAIVGCLVLAPGFGQDRSNDRDKPKCCGEYLGRLSSNPYAPDSTSNPYGRFGNPYSTNGINNPYSRAGQAFKNPLSGNSPILIGEDGKYLGKLNDNRFDPDSVSNPYGRYGSRYSPDSINNPYGRYGSPYSPDSATNPYATKAPKIYQPSAVGSTECARPTRLGSWLDPD